jgi:hypothetical protein
MNSKEFIYSSRQFLELDPEARSAIILVSEGAKPAGIAISEKNIDYVLEELGIFYDTTKLHPGYGYYITCDQEIHKKWKEVRKIDGDYFESVCKLENDHTFYGRIYGYPNCCIDTFVKELGGARHTTERLEEQKRTICNQKGSSALPRLDFIEYFPCSPVCHETLRLSKLYGMILDELDKDVSDALKCESLGT